MEDITRKEFNNRRKNPNHGQNIKWFRKKIEYSQEYLATLVKEKQQTISEWEKNECLDEEILIRVANAFDIGVIWLRDMVINTDGNQYIVESSGTNFINYESAQVAYAVHNPLEAMEESYNNSISLIKESYSEVIENLKSSLEAEKEEKRKILNMLLEETARRYSVPQNTPILNDLPTHYTKTDDPV